MSPVQVFALELCMIEDAYIAATLRGQELEYAIRNALLSTGIDFEKLYPEFIPKPEEVLVSEDQITEKDLLDPSGGWKFTYENVDQDEIMNVMRQLGQRVPMDAVPGEVLDDSGGWR